MSRKMRSRRAATKPLNRSLLNSDSDEETPMSLFLQLFRQKKRRTPKPKKAPARKKPATRKRASNADNPGINSSVGNISDDSNEVNASFETKDFSKNVESKVDDFFKNIKDVLSDSDEEDEAAATETKKESTSVKRPDSFYCLSDSDEELLLPEATNKYIKSDIKPMRPMEISDDSVDDFDNQPSTSKQEDSFIEIIETKNDNKDLDKLLSEVDAMINEIPSNERNSNRLENNKKKTQEILDSASALIATFAPKPVAVTQEVPQRVAPSCPVCLETLGGDLVASSTFCGHIFCQPCMNSILQSNNKRCPTCRKGLTKTKVHPLYL